MTAGGALRLIVVAIALALARMTPAAAQPAPCAACSRGDALIQRFSLEPLRAIAEPLAAAPLADPVTPAQYAHLVELRRHTPVLVRLGAIDDANLAAIAASLCRAETGACVDATARTLSCLAERCAVALPPADPRRVDVAQLPADCHQYNTHTRSSPLGLGIDWGNGLQRSRYPSDGGAWSLGIEGRMRFGHTLGAVARVDRIGGRDETTDADHDGHDDISTGTITRISALAGPTFVLDNTRFEDTTRFLRLDLLGGYVSTSSQANERGPAAGVDLAYQISAVRFGVRVVQGFGEAREASMLLVHLGVVAGSVPRYDDDTDCGATVATRRSPLALGLDLPLGGYGISSELGYLAPSLGIETAWHVTRALDALARADLLLYPGGDRERVLHHAVLAGLRIDHGHQRSSPTGFFTTVMGGYSHSAGFTPTTVGSGPIVDLSFAWGAQASEGAAYVRLHARAGVGPDNLDYRAVFLSGGFEVRLDPRSWNDRD
jgi:hypothetical protein